MSAISATSAPASPGASGFRSTATTRAPSSRTRAIARRWCRPAPTKRTLFTAAMLLGFAASYGRRNRKRTRFQRATSQDDCRLNPVETGFPP